MRNTLLVLIVCGLAIFAISSYAKEAAPENTDYDIHEWGVFPIARNDKWAMSDLRAEWATFPDFFYRIWPKEKLPWRGAVKKPVVYFHGTPGQQIRLSIKFSDGRPLVWWPAADSPAADSPAAGVGKMPLDQLDFSLTLFNPENQSHTNSLMPAVPKGHWIEALRDVKCSSIVTHGSHSNKREFLEKEQFIYYDGIMKAPAAPTVSREKDALVLATENDFDLLDVLVVDQSLDGKKFSIGRTFTDKIAGGKQSTKIEMLDIPDADRKTKQTEMLAELQKRIAAAGLNDDEAAALINCWREGFLANKGLYVLYRVPQTTYEKWLPLTAAPAPKKIVRVGLVMHAHLEPELDAHLETLVKQLGAEDFDKRKAAQEEIVKIGGAAFPALEKNLTHKDAEIASACKKILDALDTRPALTAPSPTLKD